MSECTAAQPPKSVITFTMRREPGAHSVTPCVVIDFDLDAGVNTKPFCDVGWVSFNDKPNEHSPIRVDAVAAFPLEVHLSPKDPNNTEVLRARVIAACIGAVPAAKALLDEDPNQLVAQVYIRTETARGQKYGLVEPPLQDAEASKHFLRHIEISRKTN